MCVVCDDDNWCRYMCRTETDTKCRETPMHALFLTFCNSFTDLSIHTYFRSILDSLTFHGKHYCCKQCTSLLSKIYFINLSAGCSRGTVIQALLENSTENIINFFLNCELQKVAISGNYFFPVISIV